jgi:hypothetical protein
LSANRKPGRRFLNTNVTSVPPDILRTSRHRLRGGANSMNRTLDHVLSVRRLSAESARPAGRAASSDMRLRPVVEFVDLARHLCRRPFRSGLSCIYKD